MNKKSLVGFLSSIFLIVFSIFLLKSPQKIEDAPISREKRQYVTRREQRTTPSDEYIRRELHDFWPAYSDRCPEQYMLCHDESYCFSRENMCGGRDICLDSSDDINGPCLERTRPVTTSEVSTTTTTMSTVTTTKPLQTTTTLAQTQNNMVELQNNEPSSSFDQFNSFKHPLVIAFFALIGSLLVYVTIATICCVTLKWNRINPTMTSQNGNYTPE